MTLTCSDNFFRRIRPLGRRVARHVPAANATMPSPKSALDGRRQSPQQRTTAAGVAH
jgi:hypothetical protein